MTTLTERLAAKPRYIQRICLGSYPYNLVRSERYREYCKLLANYDFIANKVQHPEFGVQALLEDYEWLQEEQVQANLNSETVRALRLIQGALRLSAHILSQDATQLVGQLWGRLLPYDLPEIRQVLDQAKQQQTTPRLRPIAANLMPPGGPLLRTLSGHSDEVRSVATSADGTLAVSGSYDNTVKVWDLQTGEAIARFVADHAIHSCAISPDKKTIVAGDSGGFVHFLHLEGL